MRELKHTYSRNICLLLLAGLLFVGGCSNEVEMKGGDSSSPLPVLFNAAAGTVTAEDRQITRAGIDQSNPGVQSMENLVGKKVLIYGTHYANGGSADWSNAANLLMNGLTGEVEKKDNNDYRINYAPLKYYYPENNERHDFKLFFPTPQSSASDLDDPSGITILTPTASRPFGLRVNLYRRPDFLKATVSEATKTPQPLDTKFEHLLTSVVLKIVKAEARGTQEELEQDVFINRLTVSGRIRGNYDIAKEAFETAVKTASDPKLVDIVSDASLIDPGYNRDSTYLVPAADEDPKLIQEILLFPVAPNASDVKEDMQRYFFDVWLNERRYSFMLPLRTDTDWEGWKPGERYTYTLKVNKADIYVELDGITREPWNPLPKDSITIGVKPKKQ